MAEFVSGGIRFPRHGYITSPTYNIILGPDPRNQAAGLDARSKSVYRTKVRLMGPRLKAEDDFDWGVGGFISRANIFPSAIRRLVFRRGH